jgi:hypothetical protein
MAAQGTRRKRRRLRKWMMMGTETAAIPHNNTWFRKFIVVNRRCSS